MKVLTRACTFALALCASAVMASGAAGSGSRSGSIPTGRYECYETTGFQGSYSTTFAEELNLFRNGTYNIPLQGTFNVYNHWHAKRNLAVFTSGPLWSYRTHDVGTFYRHGKLMPHATGSFASARFTLVLRDTRNEGGVPPKRESSSLSFYYCKR